MNIRTKLKLLGLVTMIGLALIAGTTIWGLRAIRSAEDTAHRRSTYVGDLLEVKASALSTIMLDPTLQETKDLFSSAAKNIDEHGSAAVGAIKRDEVRDELRTILKQWDHYNDDSQQLIKLASSDPKGANDKIIPLYNRTFKPFQTDLEKFIRIRQEEAKQGVVDAKATADEVFLFIMVLLGVGAGIAISAVLLVSSSLETGLRAILKQLAPIGQGDLTQRLPDQGKDELAEIGASFNAVISELQLIVQRTRDRSAQLANAAAQLTTASRGVLDSSSHQSDAASSVAASVEEFSVSIDHVSDNATEAEQKASDSGKLARNGGGQVAKAVIEIRRIEEVVSGAASQMQTLGEQARDISSIVNVIKEVADQTNLLALNAAIEAARAGEQGRGFAVVADEVRKLAERTTSSAQEITNMVSSVQQSTEAASTVMQSGREFVIQSVKEIEEAGNSMQGITAGSDDAVRSISEISTALREQRVAGGEIAKNVERIAQMAEEGRASASGVSSAAQQLEDLAVQLQNEVDRFRA